MSVTQILSEKVAEIVNSKYAAEVSPADIQIQKTLPEFEGDLTIVVFPFLRFSKMNPVQTAEAIGSVLVDELEEVTSFNVIKGFLNVALNNDNWGSVLNSLAKNPSLGQLSKDNSKKVMVEYSSPNTNKPLHLGHIRNNFL